MFFSRPRLAQRRSGASPAAPFPAWPAVAHGRAPLAILALIFLLIFASRVTRLNTLDLEKDEVWTVWITLGSLQQTIERTGYDWPPTHFVLVHIWRALTGIDPFTLRVSTILTMMLCAALLYRVARRWWGVRAALVAMLAFNGFGYVLFLSTLLRGYMLALTLWVLALLLTQRYFERPTRWRGLALALALAAMFYVHYTTAIGILGIGLIGLALYRRPRLWLYPGLLTALLCLPEALARLDVIRIKGEVVAQHIALDPPHILLADHYLDYAGQQPALWGALLLIASALALEHFRVQRRTIVLALWMLAPLGIIWFTMNIDAFHARHLSWVMVGFAMWIGAGLALLPRAALIAAAIVMALASFERMPLNDRYEAIPRLPFVSTFNALREAFRGGDALLLDLICAGCTPIDAEEWDYFSRAYFPRGIRYIEAADIMPPEAHRRVWYVAFRGRENADILRTLASTRAFSGAISNDVWQLRLYEAPPDLEGVLFENGMRYHGAEITNDAGLPLVWGESEMVHLRIWWSADEAIALDYSVASYLWDAEEGHVLAQFDGPPQVLDGPPETSRWEPGRYYVEERAITLPNPLPTGDYTIMLSVYQWWDSVRIGAPGADANNLLPIRSIYVKSW